MVINGWWCGLCGVIAVVQFSYIAEWCSGIELWCRSVVWCELMSQFNQPLTIVALSYSLVCISLFNNLQPALLVLKKTKQKSEGRYSMLTTK
jgi:hypothetical protein